MAKPPKTVKGCGTRRKKLAANIHEPMKIAHTAVALGMTAGIIDSVAKMRSS